MSVSRITVVGSYPTGLTMKVQRLPSTSETLLATGYRVDYGGLIRRIQERKICSTRAALALARKGFAQAGAKQYSDSLRSGSDCGLANPRRTKAWLKSMLVPAVLRRRRANNRKPPPDQEPRSTPVNPSTQKHYPLQEKNAEVCYIYPLAEVHPCPGLCAVA